MVLDKKPQDWTRYDQIIIMVTTRAIIGLHETRRRKEASMTLPATLLEQSTALPWAERFYPPSGAPDKKGEAMAAAHHRADALFHTDPDERLAYMESPEWDFSADHLRQVNRVMDEFLDVTARREVRRLAAQCLEEDGSPHGIAGQWFTEARYDELRELLDTTDVPDQLLVACYAWLEVHELAQAAYLLAKNRKMPQPDFGNFSQTPEEIEGDLRFVDAV